MDYSERRPLPEVNAKGASLGQFRLHQTETEWAIVLFESFFLSPSLPSSISSSSFFFSFFFPVG